MPIFTTIATAVLATVGVTSTFAIGALAFGLSAAASIGLSYAARALAGTKEAGSANQAFSIQGQIAGGGDVPRSFILGTYNTAGSLVYANTWSPPGASTPNAYLIQVIAVSDLPTQELIDFYVNGSLCTIDTNAAHDSGFGQAVLEYNKDGVSHLFIRYYDGTQTVADPFLVSILGTDPNRPYDSSRVGNGISYVIMTSVVNDTLFNGIPTFKFTLKGPPLYDPSQDSTNGGSGSHRWDNPATWGGDGDDLPAVQLYNVIRGISYDGGWFYGLQNMTGPRLPASNWVTQIGNCRATITGESGPEPTYRSGGQITVGVPIADTAQALLTAMQGRLSEIGGFYKLRCGAPGSADFTFSDDEILSSEQQSFTPFFGLADTINGINGKYPDPDQGWNLSVAPPLLRSDLETEDGGRRLLADVSFDLVPYAAQVQRLMKSALEEARRARRNTISLPPEFWIVEPGDIGAWTSNRNGYDAKLFRVDGMVDKANLDVLLDLTEVDPSDYDWVHGSDFRPLTPGPLDYILPDPQAIFDWTAEGVSILDADGIHRRPAIELGWDGTVQNVSAVAFEIRNAWDEVVILRGSTPNVAAGALIISQSILPATNYQARGQYIPSTPRDTVWSDWLDVTTPDTKLSLAEFDAAVTALVTQTFNDANNRINEIAEFIAEVSAEQDAANRLDKHVVKNEIVETVATTTASISEVRATAVSTEAAFAAYQISTNVTLGELGADVTTLYLTTATTDSALASLTTSVTASIGALNASVTTNATAVATINGKLAAQYSVTLDVNGYVSSLKSYNDGTFSSWTFVGTVFQIAFPGVSGGSPIPVFQVGTVSGAAKIVFRGDMVGDGSIIARDMSAGSITALNGAIDALAVKSLNIGDNAVIVPAVESRFDDIAGNGVGQVGVSSITINVDTTGLSGKTMALTASWVFKQSYTGAATFSAALYIDSTLVDSATSAATQIAVPMHGMLLFTATGAVMSFTVRCDWLGDSAAVMLRQRTLVVSVAKR